MIFVDELGETTAIDLPVDDAVALAQAILAHAGGETLDLTSRSAADLQSFQEIAATCVADGTVAPRRLSPISEHIYTRAAANERCAGDVLGPLSI